MAGKLQIVSVAIFSREMFYLKRHSNSLLQFNFISKLHLIKTRGRPRTNSIEPFPIVIFHKNDRFLQVSRKLQTVVFLSFFIKITINKRASNLPHSILKLCPRLRAKRVQGWNKANEAKLNIYQRLSSFVERRKKVKSVKHTRRQGCQMVLFSNPKSQFG
jgi:hypothetical protein